MATKAENSRKPRKARRRIPWKAIGWVTAALTVTCGVVLAVAWSVMSRDVDSFLTFFALRVPKTITKVLDRNGDVIGVFAEENRVVIPFGDIPRAFVGAVIATEDSDFMSHGGVSARGFVRAGFNFLTSFGRRREGASTLTMQLIRTVTAKRQKRLDRKLKEVILALKLEKAYTKKQIFEQYANEVYFGGGRYGIEAASQFYFGKSAPQLAVEECALLAGLVQNPNWYNPYNPDPKARAAARARRNHVLRRMAAEGYIKEADAQALSERPVRLARENAREEQVAPYPVEEVRQYLYRKYGKDKVLEGGLEVTTTIDSVWQSAANDAVRAGLRAVDRRRGYRKDGVQFVGDVDKVNLPGWNRFFEAGDSVRGVILGWKPGGAEVRIGKRVLEVPEAAFAWAGTKTIRSILMRGAAPLFIVKQANDDGAPVKLELDQEPDVEGALLAVDPGTGEIRAMVGGYDFKRSMFNRSWQAERQVGSSMKAFVYGAAFAKGLNPATMVEDVPTRFTYDATVYEPKNYERDYWGPIPIWEAVRDSRNMAAVRTLELTGIENVIAFARAAGISGHLNPYPSLALGASDLTLKEMVRGYSTFALGGRQAPVPFLIKKIVDRSGRVLENYEQGPGEQVVDPMSNFQLIQCLQGVAQRGTGARSNELNWPVAGKTGTTNDHTDAWFMGFSTRITCGVWVGLDAKKTIFRGADGAKAALPIWVDFMKAALPSTPKEDFPAPEGMEWADIDRYTGLIATSATQATDVVRLAFKPGTAPKSASTGEAIQKVREARQKANSQPTENRAWGANLAVPGQSTLVPNEIP
ncbi:penicillin-binding protein 1A [Mesoterricola silvestris]|uniref:Penicillin-binding protein n=1 Tax=Mesoterricola silvestris TaxID=2927979 RepID=A0AA48GYB2_9BACT|nr:PBP1A family penicillin-binding protein [Mesoterricola silvestris]BDU72598.1 penicillin-binding protein [Mesoterricola silvestris]